MIFAGRPSQRGVSRNRVFISELMAFNGRPSQRGVSRNSDLAQIQRKAEQSPLAEGRE